MFLPPLLTMDYLMKLLIMITFLLFSVTANAIGTETLSSAGWGDLSAAQQADIIKAVTNNADINKQKENAAITDPKKLTEWVELGEHIGQAFGGAAREIGIATNDFIKTPVGMVTIAIIVGHFAGGVLMHTMGAIFILIFGFGFINWHYRRMHITITYSPVATDIFGRAKVVSSSSKLDKDWAVAYLILALLTVIVATCTFFSV